MAEKLSPLLEPIPGDTANLLTTFQWKADTHHVVLFGLTGTVVPWVDRYRATSDAALTVVGGSSLGGLAATFAGLRHPEVFRNVLSQSGSFWWKPAAEAEPEWLTEQFVTSPKLPLRLFLELGLMESGPTQDDGPSVIVTNRHMRDVLTLARKLRRRPDLFAGQVKHALLT